ncbi:augurin-A [Stigmatopora nigra]
MAAQLLSLKVLALAALMTLLAFTEVSGEGGSVLERILKKRNAAAGGAPQSPVSVPSSRAQEFLSPRGRSKRNIWDRSRPDVQQWIMQFMYLGYDEQRLETDLSYWMDHARANDHGRQHHYDENAAIGPRDPNSYRHGANVNYDYY